MLWTDYVATRWYRAPELICMYSGAYDGSIDVWAAGCIISEIWTGRPLFPGRTLYHQLDLMTALLGHPLERLGDARPSQVELDQPERCRAGDAQHHEPRRAQLFGGGGGEGEERGGERGRSDIRDGVRSCGLEEAAARTAPLPRTFFT